MSVRSSSSSARPLKTRAPAASASGRDGQQIVGAQIGDEQALAGGQRLLELGHEVAVRRHDPLDQPVLVLEEAAGRLVVADRLLRRP